MIKSSFGTNLSMVQKLKYNICTSSLQCFKGTSHMLSQPNQNYIKFQHSVQAPSHLFQSPTSSLSKFFHLLISYYELAKKNILRNLYLSVVSVRTSRTGEKVIYVFIFCSKAKSEETLLTSIRIYITSMPRSSQLSKLSPK